MKESYPDDITLCFVQSFNGKSDVNKTKKKNVKCDELETNNNPGSYVKVSQRKLQSSQVPVIIEGVNTEFNSVELRSKSSQKFVLRKNLRLSSEDSALSNLSEVKRSFSDRFSVIGDVNGKRNSKGFLTIRKTRSTGNFSSGAAAGGCGAPRSAPATPLQIDIHPRQSKHDKNAVKPLSSSVPSVRTSTLSAGSAAGAASDASEGKTPSKSRQKKFLRHFPQVGPDERVLNYYSCALVGDILLQGHLYITKNYFAFYSNVFGYVTKLLIPTASVIRVTKEKMARIIPNAVGVCTRDERHVFGSLLSRDSTYKLMTHVWKAAGVPEILPPPPEQDLRISEADLDASEYSPEDESSSGGAESVAPPAKRRDSESIISATGGAAVIQPALLTGTVSGPVSGGVTVDVTGGVAALTEGKPLRFLLALALVILTMSATVMAYRLYQLHMYPQEELLSVSGSQVLSELVRWRGKLHARAANELHAFLTTNLLLLSKVRQSLETLSSVILTDMNQHPSRSDVPPDHTAYS